MRRWLPVGLVAWAFLGIGCGSSTELYQKAEVLADGQPYAEISIRPDAFTRGMPLKLSTTGKGRPKDWQGFVSAESGTSAALKFTYSMTPWGLATNLVHGKAAIGCDVVYLVPAGKIRLLVFNYYRREVAGADEIEKGGWGTILTADVTEGKRYRLVAKPLDMPQSRFAKVSAFTSLVDGKGTAVSQCNLFRPGVAEETKYGPTPAEQWQQGINSAARGYKFAWIGMSEALASEISEFNEALGRFREAMEADSPQ